MRSHSHIYIYIYKRQQYIRKTCASYTTVFLPRLSSHVACIPAATGEEEEEVGVEEEDDDDDDAADGWPSRALILSQHTPQYAISLQHCEWMGWGGGK